MAASSIFFTGSFCRVDDFIETVKTWYTLFACVKYMSIL